MDFRTEIIYEFFFSEPICSISNVPLSCREIRRFEPASKRASNPGLGVWPWVAQNRSSFPFFLQLFLPLFRQMKERGGKIQRQTQKENEHSSLASREKQIQKEKERKYDSKQGEIDWKLAKGICSILRKILYW